MLSRESGVSVLLALVIPASLQSQIAYPHDRMSNRDTSLTLVYADGNIRSLLNGGSKESTGGTGLIRLAFVKSNWFLAIQGSIASTVDTLTSQVGATLYSPIYAGPRRSGLLDYRRWFGEHDHGLRLYGGFSDATWGVRAATGYADSADVGIVSLGGGFFQDIEAVRLTDSLGTNRANATLELGWAARLLSGSAVDGNHTLIQDRLLGTGKTFFTGPSFGIELRVNDVLVAIQGYYFLGTHGLDDLTGLKFGAAVGGQGSLFKQLKVRGNNH